MASNNETFLDEVRGGRKMIEDLVVFMEELANSGNPGQRRALGRVIATLGDAVNETNDAMGVLRKM